jgi:hypothetical protein
VLDSIESIAGEEVMEVRCVAVVFARIALFPFEIWAFQGMSSSLNEGEAEMFTVAAGRETLAANYGYLMPLHVRWIMGNAINTRALASFAGFELVAAVHRCNSRRRVLY